MEEAWIICRRDGKAEIAELILSQGFSDELILDRPITIGGNAMSLREPVVIYTAASNVEAQLVRNALIKSGLQAFVTEDVSQVGTWMLGLMSQIHKPQVWVDRADVQRVRPVLEEFERRATELRDPEAAEGTRGGPPIKVMCETCGEYSIFPGVQRGSVQQCQFCGAYVDVENDEVGEVIFECHDENEARGEPQSGGS
jgi:hypothetical protein